MVLQGSQRNTSLHCSTSNRTRYNNTTFPLKQVSDESQLCRCGQTGFGQTLDYKFHYSSGRSNLTFAHCGGPQEKWKIAHLRQFQEIKYNCKKNPYPLPFMEEVLDVVAKHKIYSFLDKFFSDHQIMITLKDKYKTTFIIK